MKNPTRTLCILACAAMTLALSTYAHARDTSPPGDIVTVDHYIEHTVIGQQAQNVVMLERATPQNVIGQEAATVSIVGTEHLQGLEVLAEDGEQLLLGSVTTSELSVASTADCGCHLNNLRPPVMQAGLFASTESCCGGGGWSDKFLSENPGKALGAAFALLVLGLVLWRSQRRGNRHPRIA